MNKFFLIAALTSLNLFASEAQFGRVVDIKGEGFISHAGKTREIRKGESIEVGAEIVIEHKGQVTFTDNADHRYHLGNASSASVSATEVELRGGDLWFQSLNKSDSYKVKSANAAVEYSGGEAILSYDSVKGKTQLMVINGMMKLSNLRASELNLNVSEGHFSFIDNAYDEGAPRDPTPVGEKTYGQLVGLFTGVTPMDKNSAAIFKDHPKEHAKSEHSEEGSRAIASVSEVAPKESKKESKKKNDDTKMIEEYKSSLFAKSTSKKVVTNKVSTVKVEKIKATVEKLVVHIYGQSSVPTVAFRTEASASVSKSRAPASVLDQEVPNDKIESATVNSPAASSVISPYSKEFKNQYKESDKLIDDLKKL
jgi:hypothetical protein